MVYWVAFPGHNIKRGWYHTCYDTRILKGPLDKLIGRENYQIFKAGTHPLLKNVISKEFGENHSLHGGILEIYDVKHLIFLKTSLEDFSSFTRNRFKVNDPKIYKVDPDIILHSEKLISIRAKRTQKRHNLQQALSNLCGVRNAVNKLKAKEEIREDFPVYVMRIINGHNDLAKENKAGIRRLQKRIEKLDNEIKQLHTELMKLWQEHRADL